MKVLNRIFVLIKNNSMKLILLSIVSIFVLAIGAASVNLATGNETLIEKDTKAFQDNLELEKEFGGESIIVLYESENPKDLLTIESIQHMEKLEEKLNAYDEIYTIISPNTMIQQISVKQSEKYLEGLNDVTAGLEKMGTTLKEISDKLGKNIGGNQGNDNLELNFENLNSGISKMIEGQKKLSDGTGQLVTGYSNIGNQLYQASINLKNLSDQLGKSLTKPEQQKQLQQLSQMTKQLEELSKQMVVASEKGAKLNEVPKNTITGLSNMQQGLNGQISSMNQLNSKKATQLNELKTLANGLSEMGNQLIVISENLNTMIAYSDNMTPALPKTQKTLNKMIYDDNGNLRDIFSGVMADENNMLMIVKFKGGVNDSTKSEVAGTIQNHLNNNELSEVSTLVSGKPVLDDSIRTSMRDSMKKMMGLSILFMIIVLTVIFKVKWRLLPLIVIMLAVIATIGLMGWLSIPMTMVSMAVFPILIGLGIDYAIQFQSRYTEEMEKEGETE
ncbi:MMPL family transporter [Falsibacillus pallidus]|uniref:MMPL family protein n=1 Tax=Falsibacillus pallidus TaxID=493781 RepID=A0A370G2U2_9BACI|nr:MMPL family transporter [Falsibacillus pallidus]RDI37550.1 MMPL family protein [Falsibacillus pallidus]